MDSNLQEKIKYLENENFLLKSRIKEKNKIIKKLVSRNKFLESGLIPHNSTKYQITIQDLLRS